MNDSPRLLAREEAEEIIHRAIGLSPFGESGTSVYIQHWWNGELRWARNRVSLASDRRDIRVSISATSSATTNQVDDESLSATAQAASRGTPLKVAMMDVPAPTLPTPTSIVWSDATYNVTAEQRGKLARLLAQGAEAKKLLSAGYIEMRAAAIASYSPARSSEKSEKRQEPFAIQYERYSQSQCSVTVRHPAGTGSGWAGLSSYDWAAIDSAAMAQRALDKCVASLNPVAIEPGRYTVILEPQALCDLVEPLISALCSRYNAETGYGPFALEKDEALQIWRTKLGLKVVDERISISHDPSDPQLGVLTYPGMVPTTWIDHGVLTTLSYLRGYALQQLNENLAEDARDSFRISGGGATMDEMIQSTKRGLLVTRFYGVRGLDDKSLLTTGVTRDGLWLVENGRISKAIKNLRFTESPLFVLNQVEQIGPAVPVFRPMENPYNPGLRPAIVPAIKSNDFSFTSTSDAV